MADLKETAIWEPVTQIETSDPVMGGENGVSNRGPRQLANRDLWLKNAIAAAVADIGNLSTGKANKATTLAGYNISDAYNQTAINNLLAGKANNTVTITGINGLKGGGALSGSQSLTIDKATAADITNGTVNKVIAADILKPELDKKSNFTVEQILTNVKASRTANIDYVNSTGKPIHASVSVICSAQSTQAAFLVDGLQIQTMAVTRISESVYPTVRSCFSVIVPAGSTYKVETLPENILRWVELR